MKNLDWMQGIQGTKEGSKEMLTMLALFAKVEQGGCLMVLLLTWDCRCGNSTPTFTKLTLLHIRLWSSQYQWFIFCLICPDHFSLQLHKIVFTKSIHLSVCYKGWTVSGGVGLLQSWAYIYHCTFTCSGAWLQDFLEHRPTIMLHLCQTGWLMASFDRNSMFSLLLVFENNFYIK